MVKFTPIQQKIIKAVLGKKDVMIRDQTGSGKTFTVSLAAAEKVKNTKETVVLIAPNPSCAKQMYTWTTTKLDPSLVQITYRGGPKLMKPTPMIIGTPTSLLDHAKAQTLDIRNISMMFLDEVDSLAPPIPRYNMRKQNSRKLHPKESEVLISKILEVSVKRPQLVMASATLSYNSIKHLNYLRWLQDYDFIDTGVPKPPNTIQHEVLLVPVNCCNFAKVAQNYIKKHNVESSIGIYLNEKQNPFPDKHPHQFEFKQREKATFRSIKELESPERTMVRGLDGSFSHIFILGVPDTAAEYIHFTGRVGRFGNIGTCVSIVTPLMLQKLSVIFKYLNLEMKFLPEVECFSLFEDSLLTKNSN